ncbi:MAG: PLDc N-terminal domain-containing protein [Nocardioides sp.]|nr:PLDc N-terminal domain-containing protein [Nocardioides sp.]
MIKLELLGGVVAFVLWVYCLVDVIGTPERNVRNLPKVGWLLLVLLFPLVGSIAWLVAGRPQARVTSGPATAFSEYDRPGRAVAADPEKDEAFLRDVRARAEEQRRRYEQAKRLREQQDPDQPS